MPKNIIPVHYDLLLDIDLEKLRFGGNVKILANVTSSTNLVLVHVNEMNVTSVKVSTKNGGEFSLYGNVVPYLDYKCVSIYGNAFHI